MNKVIIFECYCCYHYLLIVLHLPLRIKWDSHEWYLHTYIYTHRRTDACMGLSRLKSEFCVQSLRKLYHKKWHSNPGVKDQKFPPIWRARRRVFKEEITNVKAMGQVRTWYFWETERLLDFFCFHDFSYSVSSFILCILQCLSIMVLGLKLPL